jgi:hypothetical protein
LGVGGRKRKNVGVKARKKRVGSWGKKKNEKEKGESDRASVISPRELYRRV